MVFVCFALEGGKSMRLSRHNLFALQAVSSLVFCFMPFYFITFHSVACFVHAITPKCNNNRVKLRNRRLNNYPDLQAADAGTAPPVVMEATNAAVLKCVPSLMMMFA